MAGGVKASSFSRKSSKRLVLFSAAFPAPPCCVVGGAEAEGEVAVSPAVQPCLLWGQPCSLFSPFKESRSLSRAGDGGSSPWPEHTLRQVQTDTSGSALSVTCMLYLKKFCYLSA